MSKLKFVLAVLSAVSLVYLTIDSSSLSSEPAIFGAVTKTKIWIAAGIVGLSTLVALLESSVIANRMRQNDWVSRSMMELTFPLWALLEGSMADQQSKNTFGVSVWLVPRWHWTLIPRSVRDKAPASWRRKLPTPRMWRAAHYRMTPAGADSGISWRRGVGAIGLCWLQRAPFFFDMEVTWGTAILSETDWNLLSSAARMRLRYSEYLHLAGRYRTVFCYPIFRDRATSAQREFIGCIVLDTALNAPLHDIQTPQIRSDLLNAANLIALKLERR